MKSSDRWRYSLKSEDAQCIGDALQALTDAGKARIPFTKEDFPVGGFGETLNRLRQEIEEGSGVVLIRGLDVDRYGLDGTRLVYYGLGLHLGTPVAQNPQADLLVDVRDFGGDPYQNHTARGYHTAQYLPFHNDQADVVGLLSYRTARSGGLSCITSSAAIHDEILATRPDLLELLYEPFGADVRGEEPEGRKPFYLEPRFAVFDGKFYAQHGPTYVKSAQRFADAPRLTDAKLEAMTLIDQLAVDDRFRLDMDFRRGDIQFLNNHTVLHSRTGFVDFDELDQKRHLLRLWLRTPRYAKVAPFFAERYEDMDHWLAHPKPHADRQPA